MLTSLPTSPSYAAVHSVRFGSDGCPVCLGAMALQTTHQEMQRIRQQQAAPMPTVMPAYDQMQESVAGSRATVVPVSEEDNVLLGVFKRLFDRAKQRFTLKADPALLNVVMQGVDRARHSHGDTPKTLQGSNAEPVPFFPKILPKGLQHPHTYNVVHYSNHATDDTPGKTLKNAYALGHFTLTQPDASRPELLQLNARDYPTGQSWMAAGTATALSTAMAAGDKRFQHLAVVAEPYRRDLPNPYQPDVLAFLEQLRQRRIGIEEYALPEAGKLGKHTLPQQPLPKSYLDVLKTTYPDSWQTLRVFRIPLDAFKKERERLTDLIQRGVLNPLYLEDKLLGYVWNGEQAGVA